MIYDSVYSDNKSVTPNLCKWTSANKDILTTSHTACIHVRAAVNHDVSSTNSCNSHKAEYTVPSILFISSRCQNVTFLSSKVNTIYHSNCLYGSEDIYSQVHSQLLALLDFIKCNTSGPDWSNVPRV